MRIIVHDYAGHPFEVQLSRALADRGHHVMHLYCESTLTPRGALKRSASDPRTFDISAVGLSEMIPKTSFLRRFKLESEYAHRLLAVCEQFQPEVVLSANTPSIPAYRLAKWCQRRGIRLVSWIQDIYGVAAYRLLSKQLPVIGHAVGSYFIRLDKWSARHSAALVVISDDFRKIFRRWGIEKSRIHVIHNWAPLEEMPQRPRENDWSRAHQLGPRMRFVYAGTLAMKHNPALLLELARTLDQPAKGELIVVSEGTGVDWLVAQAAKENIKSLRSMGFQPFEALPDVLGSADVLVAILEADAGVFSVPSKVLSLLLRWQASPASRSKRKSRRQDRRTSACRAGGRPDRSKCILLRRETFYRFSPTQRAVRRCRSPLCRSQLRHPAHRQAIRSDFGIGRIAN